MAGLIAFWSHAFAAALFAALVIWELRRGIRIGGGQRMLLAALALTSCWAWLTAVEPFSMLAAYAETDTLCYRADSPNALIGHQAETWDPLIDWAQQRYDIGFEIVHGIMHEPQPPETVTRLAAAVHGYDAWRLAALQPLVTIAGSLVIALALAEGEIDVESAFAAAQLDELWQVEQWGEDELATRARENKRADFKPAARFLALLV